MASGDESLTRRSMARIRQILGVTNTQDLAAGPVKKPGSIHYGMFTTGELRHVDALSPRMDKSKQPTELDIIGQLKEIASSSKKSIDEIDNLKIMAPELSLAETIIVSSIMSPQDLQTDSVAITVDSPDISADTKAKINELLTDYFNDEFHLGPKLSKWLGAAAFHDGAKAFIVLPQTEIDVLNEVADSWDPLYRKDAAALKGSVAKSTESLVCFKGDDYEKLAVEMLSETLVTELNKQHVGCEFLTDEDKEKFTKKYSTKDKDGKTVKVVAPTTKAIAETLIKESFKILKGTDDGCGVVVTRDMSAITKGINRNENVFDQFSSDAERQVRGYKRNDANNSSRPQLPVLTISDIIKTNKGDLPILVEFPADSVIPVCAPGDNENHLGYFVMIDEFGQPVRGEYAFDGTNSNDATYRLATNAARSIFGNANISSFQMAGMTQGQMIDNMTNMFSVAVNYLLSSKLKEQGLRGLKINVHDAVGKNLFFNLLAKNGIKLVFVPEPMMVYYRFDHRKDGTGKSMLEDIKFILAIRCTLMIAKLMAAIDNATKHRIIEVQIDDKNQNPIETIENARQMFINKRAPNITNDPKTAAESIINQHLSIRPKGMPGVADDLSVTYENQYGNSQSPDNELLDAINNMIGQGLKIPPTVLNNLNEAEYARSVATSNLFFANNVRNWQNTIRPHNKKFLINYILSCNQLVAEIKKIIDEDLQGAKDDKTKENTSDCIKENQDKTAEEIVQKVIATVELVLPAPAMSTSKAHFEELNAQSDAISKLLELIYPDDVAPSDELKSYMASIRALVASKLVKEFLPRLGIHEIADVPSIEEVETNESAKIIQFLANLKRRMDDLTKLSQGQLPNNAESPLPAEATTSTETPAETGGEGGEEGGGGDNDDGLGIPGF